MKENIKIFIIALIIGMVVAFFLSYKFRDDIVFALHPEATIFYVASYSDIDLANNKASTYQNSVIYFNGEIYKVVIGVFYDENVINLMDSYFKDQGLSFLQENISIDSIFLKNIKNLEELIKASDRSYYENINASLLDLFHEYMLKKAE